MFRRVLLTAALAFVSTLPAVATAHGFAGKRFFPATLAVEDAFVADEADFLGSYTKGHDDAGNESQTTAISAEFAKRLSKDWQFSIGNAFSRLSATGQPTLSGWDNFEVGVKYQAFIDPQSESALAFGLSAEVGDTGNSAIVETSTSYGPAMYYAKGFGNVSADWAKPLAFTFVAQPTFSTESGAGESLEWGMTLQYSLPYMQSFVHDTGMSEPFRSMIPLLEVPMSTCMSRCGPGPRTTGSFNPGFVWIGKKSQLGFELVLPMNDASGRSVGVLLQYHLYLDDFFPSWKY